MSITSNFPAIKPTLLLDFANTEKLDPRITFTRASTATYYGTETAKAEENLILHSEEFGNGSGWSYANVTVNDNTDTAPNGTTTAERITSNSTPARCAVDSTTASFAASQPLTISVFAKALSATFLQIFIPTAVLSGGYANFNLSTGAVGDSGGTGLTASIVSAGNSWYRCIVSIASVSASATDAASFNMVDSATAARGANFSTNAQMLFLWGAQVEQRSTATNYTPTTTQTITNYIPVLESQASGVARFDHNPTTFESLGLEIEESRTNLILQSEDLDTSWAETRATLSLNGVISPSGTLTADKLIASTDNNTHFTSQTFTGTAASHTFTVYAKANGLNHVALRLFNGTSQVGLAYYNLSTGATGTVTAGTAAITTVGNGFFRCSLTATLAASASCTADIQLANADNTNSFIGNAFDGVSLWGTQVELGSFATSYIPTVASQVTRAVDAASMTGTNFSSWYNQAEGTLYAEGNTPSFATTYVFADINDGSVSNFIRQSTASNATNTQFVIQETGVTTASPGVVVSIGSNRKMAGAYAINSVQQSVNGLLGTEDTIATIPSGVSQMNIGARPTGANLVNSTIRKIAYYPLRVTNAQLQGLTS